MAKTKSKEAPASSSPVSTTPKQSISYSNGMSSGISNNVVPKAPVPPAPASGSTLGHVKWPALFKKHTGLLEAHRKLLTRVQQSLGAELHRMISNAEERAAWEERERRDEQSNWAVICGMVDRTAELLVQAKNVANSVIPPKKGVQKKKKDKNQVLGVDSSGTGADKEETAEEISGDADVGADFVPLRVTGFKRKREEGSESDTEGKAGGEEDGEANPYFMVDTQPTPVDLKAGKKAKKEKKKRKVEEISGSGDDNTVAANELKKMEDVSGKAKSESLQEEAAATTEIKKDKKKRKKSESGYDAEAEVKKSKNDMKKRKAEESGNDEGDGNHEESEKKKKKKHKHKKD